ncbi:anthranilate phosphoribosyltransferase [Polynucleobacter sp. MWH-Spelu-300-X4]|uniref:anthranilate phosphoribosyltransferase n=1 Tax=Polynucleobacter sp. MWH-Spelu-300-X4 TaxID=2689109 RepID=UPI001BFDB454|nr:anthranilate phosphoribosyltransferase [Polynucleobacter sp. MWH-Spelu-300-X4]QWD79944.1 anthranilate phosphoribosyltransferase [Polynucleobacter sp. MWH-Spelu-300-X4]
MSITPQDALQRCIEQREIFHDEMLHIMRLIMNGELSPVMTAAILAGLRTKKETIGEITAAATVMREFATHVKVNDNSHFVDIVGTGGDGAQTFNISTTAMFVAAAAGAKVAKHGGRSVSSKSGAADVLEALGVQITLQAPEVATSLNTCGMGFMFAPNHHPAMKNVAPIRKEMGVRTIFNILGPLTNPAGAPHMLMGVFHPDLVGIQVRALQRLGTKQALVVYGKEGLDEISLEGPTMIGELKNDQIKEYEIHPSDFGLKTTKTDTFKVADAEASKKILLSVLDNQAGPALDIVCLNAGAALYAGNLAKDIGEGLQMAKAAIASGKAKQKLEEFIKTTQNLAK